MYVMHECAVWQHHPVSTRANFIKVTSSLANLYLCYSNFEVTAMDDDVFCISITLGLTS